VQAKLEATRASLRTWSAQVRELVEGQEYQPGGSQLKGWSLA